MAESKDKWLEDQIACYRAEQPAYKTYAGTLEDFLRAAAKVHAPLAVIQTRPKTVSSFAEKAMRREIATRQ